VRTANPGHAESGDHKQAADHKASPNVNSLAYTHQQHACEERIEQACETNVELLFVDAPSANYVTVWTCYGKLDQQTCGEEYKDAECLVRKLADADSVEDVRDVLEEEGPGGAIERVHLVPPPDVHGRKQRQKGEADQHHKQHLPNGRPADQRKRRPCLEIKEGRPNDTPHDHHGLQANQTAFIEVPLAHLPPTIVVGIGDHESGKKKKEIDGQIAVVQNLLRVIASGIDLEGMEHHDDQGGYATQTVEDLVVALSVTSAVRGDCILSPI